MKKNFVYLLALLIFSLFIGCSQFSNLVLPKKVTVKAEPKIQASVGSIDLQLYEDDTIGNMVQGAFMYKPEGYSNDEIRLLMKYPIMEVPLDISSYLENVGISDKVSGVSFSQSIEIPELKVSEKMDVELDSINDRIVNLVQFGGFTTDGTLSVEIETQETFDAITFETGELVLETYREMPANEVVTISYKGTEIAKGNVVGKICRLDLSGKTVYRSGMSYDFSPSKDITNYFLAHVENGKISSVSGLTLNNVDIPFTQTIATKSSFESFDTCTIKEGDIKLGLAIDNSWSGVNISYPVTLSGGISGTSKTVNGNEIIDLTDAVLLPDDTTVNTNVTISFNKGKINFAKKPVISFETDIKSIKEVSLTLPDFNSSVDNNVDLGADVLKLVKQFDLGKSTIYCRYTNTLPEGNDSIGIKFASKFLGFDSTEELKANKQNQPLAFSALYDSHIVNISANPQAADEFNSIDLSFGVSLPGSTPENPKKVKLVNVELGATYTLGFELDKSVENCIDYKWNAIVLMLDDMSVSDTVDTGFSKSMITDNLKGLISTPDGSAPEFMLDELSTYIYFVKPEGMFDALGISGYVKVPAAKDDPYIINTAGGDKINFASNLPELEYDAKTGAVITDVSAYDKTKYDENNLPYFYKNLADTVNSLSDENVVVDYDITCSFGKDAGGLTIKYDDIEKGKSSNISVMMYLIIPLKFGFKNDVCINITDILGIKKDIFNRESASSETSIDEFMQYFESAKINYKVGALPVSCNGWKFTFNPYGEDPAHVDDTIEANFSVGRTGEIAISDMPGLLKVYPLIPTVRLDIPGDPDVNNSWITIGASGKASIDLSMEIQTNIEISKETGLDKLLGNN